MLLPASRCLPTGSVTVPARSTRVLRGPHQCAPSESVTRDAALELCFGEEAPCTFVEEAACDALVGARGLLYSACTRTD